MASEGAGGQTPDRRAVDQLPFVDDSAVDLAKELAVERAALTHIGKANDAYLQHTRQVAAGLAAEAAEAIEDGIRDIVDEDAEADAAVQAVLVRQASERAMYAARRVADLEAQGEALAFGKLVADDDTMLYVGRRTVFDGDEALLIDWRARAAIPFYRATPLEPMGYRQRRHLMYDETGQSCELVDYSDEIFDVERLSNGAAPQDGLRGEAALLANLVAPTGEHMRSVVATIQAEQDAVIRSPAHRMLIVQGGPGTGKTVVALHRAAYLLYDQRADLADTGVLIVGPSNQFLNYISGVLPSLGESGVVSVTVPRLYRGVRLGHAEPAESSAIKADIEMVDFLAAAVGLRRREPSERFVSWYGSRRVVISEERIQVMFARAARQTLHNDGAARFRRDVIDDLIYQVYDPTFHNLDDARESFTRSEQVNEFLLRHFPPLSPEQALNDLLGSKALLRAGADVIGADPDRYERLHRTRCSQRRLELRVWSDADAAVLDELLHLLGPLIADGQRLSIDDAEHQEAWIVRDEADEFELAASRDDNPMPSIEPFERAAEAADADGPNAYTDPYFDDEPEADDDSGTVSLAVLAEEEELSVERERAAGETATVVEGRPAPEYDGAPAEALHLEAVDAADDEGATVVELVEGERSWQFGHVIVDEAQDLTAMQWRMVARRSSGGGLTVVGDLAQRVGPPAGTWNEVVPSELARHDLRHLTINYRSPAEIDGVASAILQQIAPNLPSAQSLRTAGRLPQVIRNGNLRQRALDLATAELQQHPTFRVACITVRDLGPVDDERLSVLHPRQAKGLEFDVVIVIEPAEIIDLEYGLNLCYVAVTRATHGLIVVHERTLPSCLEVGLNAVAAPVVEVVAS